MEYHVEETFSRKEENSGAIRSFDNSRQSNACGAHKGSELVLKETMIAEAENEDIKFCAGTAGCLSERKEPPPAKPQHPLKNSQQRESLLDMRDTIHCGPPKERTENNTKKEILTWEENPGLNDYSVAKPKVIDAGDQMESLKLYPQKDSKNETLLSDSPSNVALPTEPGSILEKLLRRNRKEAIPSLSKIKEADSHNKDSTAPVDTDAKEILPSTASVISREQGEESDLDIEVILNKQTKASPATDNFHDMELDMKHAVGAHNADSDLVGFQPAVAKSHYSRAESINSTDTSVKAAMEIQPNIGVSSDNLQSAVSHERISCEASGVISEESAPTVCHAETPAIKSDGPVVDLCNVLTTEKTDTNTVGTPPRTKSDTEAKTSCSDRADTQPVKRQMVKECHEDTAAPAGNAGAGAGAGLVAGESNITEKSNQVSLSMKQNLQNLALNSGNASPDQMDKKTCKDTDGSVSMRDKSQSTPKSRPVSDLIKETIQLHEKLQHHDRPKPAEVKPDEQGQSVKVAQMKAAFDSPLKTPDKTLERKPSMRRGKDI
ncbi:uncharacterized protein LOC142382750 [Odontesthes bonariensis]|uniref:uncharacterized protein LOC142382750 n=1 Tax=Odontesthes bonariensis TaxID=219752 RepID=UPI003F5821EC